MTPYYFDHNASTPPYPEVLELMQEWSLPTRWANPSAKHHAGKMAAKAIRDARESIAQLIDAKSEEEVFFCSGATESINLGLQGLIGLLAESNTPTLVGGFADEHPAVGLCLSSLQARFQEHSCLEINPSINWSEDYPFPNSDPRLFLLCRMLAQNETGKIYDLLAIRANWLRKDDWLFSDLSQAIGKIKVSVQDLNIQMGSCSGHKFGGPAGTGVLYLSRSHPRLNILPLMYGGGQELGFRPGSLNLPGIVGLGLAAKITHERWSDLNQHLILLQKTFEKGLLALVPEAKIIEEDKLRLPNTSMVLLPEDAVEKMKLNVPGLSVTQGAACASSSGKPSHVLSALGLKKAEINYAYRFSFGRTNTVKEIENCLQEAFN